MRQASRRALVAYARDRYARQTAMWGTAPDALDQARRVLDPETLTLGFARRFATYKRPTLLLRDTERLSRLLTDSERPMQLIVAGKAHPADRAGQEMIREWIAFTARPEVRGRVIFLSDYDMLLTEQLVCGVDVWLNTPRRPWEACGTSGMKVLANGGLNLSELDGWWAEAYGPDVGWAMGDGREHGDDPAWDAVEANALYAQLEQEVAPQFYRRDKHGIPVQWLDKVRESMVTLTARFSSNRAVREYTESYYLPAAAAFEKRRADNAGLGRQLVDWQTRIHAYWPALRFGRYGDQQTVMESHEFQVHVVPGQAETGRHRGRTLCGPDHPRRKGDLAYDVPRRPVRPSSRDYLSGAGSLRTSGGPLHGPDRSRSPGGSNTAGGAADFMATLTGIGCRL